MRPRELLIVAGTGGSPTARSTGKLTRVPEPTTALMPPAQKPAAATAAISQPVMRPSQSSLTRTTLSAPAPIPSFSSQLGGGRGLQRHTRRGQHRLQRAQQPEHGDGDGAPHAGAEPVEGPAGVGHQQDDRGGGAQRDDQGQEADEPMGTRGQQEQQTQKD